MNRFSLYDVMSLKRCIIHLKWNIASRICYFAPIIIPRQISQWKAKKNKLKLSCIFGDIFETIFVFFWNFAFSIFIYCRVFYAAVTYFELHWNTRRVLKYDISFVNISQASGINLFTDVFLQQRVHSCVGIFGISDTFSLRAYVRITREC